MHIRSIVMNVTWFVHSLAVCFIIRVLHVVLVLFALFCFFAVLEQIVDEGGGASGVHARRQVTVAQRIVLASIFGSLGVLGAVGAYKLKGYDRRIAPFEIHGATKLATGTPEPSPLKSGVWDRELDSSL